MILKRILKKINKDILNKMNLSKNQNSQLHKDHLIYWIIKCKGFNKYLRLKKSFLKNIQKLIIKFKKFGKIQKSIIILNKRQN